MKCKVCGKTFAVEPGLNCERHPVILEWMTVWCPHCQAEYTVDNFGVVRRAKDWVIEKRYLCL